MPAISVLLPVYNAAHFIDKAITSILTQTMKNFEFIIINDGSTDSSGEILQKFAHKDIRIRLVQRPNKGLISTLNEGIALARSPFIARMDADDIALPNRLKCQYEYLSKHPETLALGSYIQLMDEYGEVYRTKRLPIGPHIQEALRWGSPLAHPSVMIRTEAMRKAGGYPSDFPAAEDYALWLRLLSLGKIDNLPDVLLSYRVHGTSVSHKHARQQRDSTLRAQALWIAGRLFDKELCRLSSPVLLATLNLPPQKVRGLLARMLALNPHVIGTTPEQDPEAQKWLPRILQGPMTPEIRKAMALYHLRAARAPELSTRDRLYHLGQCIYYSPHDFIGKVREFLRGRLQRC